MSNGYRRGSDDETVSFEIVSPFPAGSLSTTSTDMAKFMLAYLQEESLGDARILRPGDGSSDAQPPCSDWIPAANGMAHGFYEETKNGHRIVGHAGDTLAFHSDLHLIPDSGVGFFVSYNSGGKGEISPRNILWEAFLDRYFPFNPTAEPTLDTAKDDARAVSGMYEGSRRSETSFLKVASILGETQVSARDDGTIEIPELKETNGNPKRWREVAPMTFRDVNAQDLIIFRPDADGVMQLILPYPFMVFKRVGTFENSKLLLPVVGISLLIMLLTLLLTPIAWLVRRHYGKTLEFTPLQRQAANRHMDRVRARS
jgi:hypothetical protein